MNENIELEDGQEERPEMVKHLHKQVPGKSQVRLQIGDEAVASDRSGIEQKVFDRGEKVFLQWSRNR